MRFILDMVAALEMLVTLQFSHSWAVIRAEYTFYKIKNEWCSERKRIQDSRHPVAIPERKNFSILWQYYAKGKKTFDKL